MHSLNARPAQESVRSSPEQCFLLKLTGIKKSCQFVCKYSEQTHSNAPLLAWTLILQASHSASHEHHMESNVCSALYT